MWSGLDIAMPSPPTECHARVTEWSGTPNRRRFQARDLRQRQSPEQKAKRGAFAPRFNRFF